MKELLQRLNAIFPLSKEAAHYFETHIQTKKFKRNEYLLKKGHVNRDIFFVEKGITRCYYMKDDQEINSWFMKEGDVVVSVSSFFKQKESIDFIQALEPTLVHSISHAELKYLTLLCPEMPLITVEILEQYYMLSEERSAILRFNTAKERIDSLNEVQPELSQRVAAKHIASYLGMTEETYSNVKNHS